MPYGSHSTPTRAEAWLEYRLPGYRFGIVLVLLLASFVVLAIGPSDPWARVVTVGLEGLTLLAALLASRTGRRLFRVASVIVVVTFLTSIASVAVSSSTDPTGWFFALNVLLVAAAPVAIARSLIGRHHVDVHTVMGAICIYVLIGMAFAFLYAAMSSLGSDALFVQTSHPKLPIFLYFSYVTQTTTGYGDYTTATNLGHAVAVVEALIGQLYLVTVIAVLVSRLNGTRTAAYHAEDTAAAAAPDTDPRTGTTPT